MDPQDPRKEEYELADIDGHFCIYTPNRLRKDILNNSYYIYELRLSNKKQICGIRENIDSDEKFGGSIISKVPIYINGEERLIQSCELLGLYIPLTGFLMR